MTIDNLQQAVEPLVGLRLSISRRAADMRIFHFGEIREVDGGTVGQFALHIQCPWRIDGPNGIVTGRGDLWEHVSREAMPEDWKPSLEDNVQDTRLRNIFGGYDTDTQSHVKRPESFVVDKVQTNEVGDLQIHFSSGYRLVLFPDGFADESWRLFEPEKDTPHLVVEGKGSHLV